MKSTRLFRAVSLPALALVAVAAHAQVGGVPSWDLCISADPGAKLHSDDYGFGFVPRGGGQLFQVAVGVTGTTSYGGQNGNCFAPTAITTNASGRFSFSVGSVGSVQSTVDDNMALTFGAPFSMGGTWGGGNIVQGDPTGALETTVFGANGFDLAFGGESDTYYSYSTTNGTTRTTARFDIIADACRIQWTMQNTAATTRRIGLNVGHWVALLANDGQSTGGPLGGLTYVDIPGARPPRTEQRYIRANDPTGFPTQVTFNLSQTEAYGLRVNTTQTTATVDPQDPSQSLTDADEIALGNSFFLLGGGSYGSNGIFGDILVGGNNSDVSFRDDSAYLMKYYPTAVAAGGTRTIIQFYNSTWSDASYGRPYSVVVDTPKVLNLAAGASTTFEKNPFTIRVYVDNDRGFANVNQELPLQDVRVKLTLPSGLTIANGGSTEQVISRIEARRVGFVDFTVQADDTASGDLNYTATITPSPGPVKTVSGVIRAVSQPRLPLYNGANLVTEPFNFDNPTWEAILGLTVDQDYQAFVWDPVQAGYVIQTGPERGRGTWIVSRADRGVVDLGSNPKKPTDDIDVNNDGSGGAPLITLKQGWNLIGNPYPISIPLGQIVGSSNANTSGAFTYAGLVQQGIISGSLAYWDNPSQTYRFIQGDTARLEAQRGYWVFVFTQQDVILRFPPVYQTFYRSAIAPTVWTQSDKQWRLQLAARNGLTNDDQNYIGVAKSDADAKATRVYEPPMAPVKGAVSVSVQQDVDGKTQSLAQSLLTGGNRQSYKVRVESRDAGPVTLTWPNLSTIPKNVRVRMVDTATGETRDLRKFSGYTFTAESRSVRDLTVQVEPGSATRVVIGNVVAVQEGRDRDRNAPFTILYTLGADATTSVRILGLGGREVYAVTRGRADKAGANTVTWNLRDNANRSVAPGAYQVEVVAEGQDGERSRKIYPVNVVR